MICKEETSCKSLKLPGSQFRSENKASWHSLPKYFCQRTDKETLSELSHLKSLTQVYICREGKGKDRKREQKEQEVAVSWFLAERVRLRYEGRCALSSHDDHESWLHVQRSNQDLLRQARRRRRVPVAGGLPVGVRKHHKSYCYKDHHGS